MTRYSFRFSVMIMSMVIALLSIPKILNAQYPISTTQTIYLSFDNVTYSEGDTVHFQAFLSNNGIPGTDSKTMFVDWFSSSDSLLAHQAYPIVNATAAGQWVVPTFYEGANFKAIAYTSAMIRNDSYLAFHKEIPILGRMGSASQHMRIFPEGGSLVAGVSNRIGYHLDGLQENNLYLLSNLGDTVQPILTMGKQYGTFDFVPELGKTYRIGATDIVLPVAQSEGIAMEATTYPNSVVVMFRKTKNFLSDSMNLIGYMDGEIVYQSIFLLKNRDSGFVEIKTRTLPTGKMQLFLSDKNGEILLYRPIYVPSREKEPIFFNLVDVTKAGSATKGLQLNYQDSIPVRLSISIRDTVFKEPSNIKGWLQLGKNIPDSALQKNDPASIQALDEVLRCSVLTKSKQSFSENKNYFSLSGKVKGKIQSTDISLILRSEGGYQPLKLAIDANGYFHDSTIVLFDTCYLALAKGQEKLSLDVDSLPPSAFSKSPYSSNRVSLSYVKSNTQTSEIIQPTWISFYGDTSRGHHVLPKVVVQAPKWRTKADSVRDIYMSDLMKLQYDNGRAAYDINFENDPSVYLGGAKLWDLLLGKLPGFGYNPSNPSKLPVNKAFLDEIEMSPEGVSDLVLPQIAFVRFLPRPDSTILIYTKKYHDPSLKARIAHNWGKSIIGYTSYIPFGQSMAAKDKSIPDRRKTLYWEPGVTLSKDNPTLDIKFETNSIAKKMLVVVEGVKADGTPIHYEQVIDK
ncbi:hypothetical protein [Rhizosphaericola mali]|uniref:Uncharacterized protein n=1 Tax=Rhizosphaericola mali TaxID=2545455 RepID=A0A5P2G1Z9_9BACT|nr:hypothetical protein [Rhizosphaericola mali]QES89485.1 hypothetical protein E0W69_012695 [Rhizosphaericola mali]